MRPSSRSLRPSPGILDAPGQLPSKRQLRHARHRKSAGSIRAPAGSGRPGRAAARAGADLPLLPRVRPRHEHGARCRHVPALELKLDVVELPGDLVEERDVLLSGSVLRQGVGGIRRAPHADAPRRRIVHRRRRPTAGRCPLPPGMVRAALRGLRSVTDDHVIAARRRNSNGMRVPRSLESRRVAPCSARPSGRAPA